MISKPASVLLVGSESALSNGLHRFFEEDGIDVYSTTRRSERIRDETVSYLELLDPSSDDALPATDFAIILAGVTSEKNCQADPATSRAVNVDATVRLARKLAARGTFVLFVSSSRVFDGVSPNPSPSDPIKPNGLYGQYKAEAELQLLGAENLAILRLTKVVGSPSKLAAEISSKIAKGESVVFNSNVVVSPLNFEDVYSGMRRILDRKSTGLFQLGGQESMTEPEFAETWLREFPDILGMVTFNARLNPNTQIVHNSLATHLPALEEQYDELIATPRITFGLMSGHTYLHDPKRLTFTLSRYKFVSKMLRGAGSVLEVGCADAFGSALVRTEVDHLVATDFDPTFISDAARNHPHADHIEFRTHDFLEGPIKEDFDAAYALDVLEHISPDTERNFLQNILNSLGPKAICIIGMPSIESQPYASEASRRGHVNCKSGSGLKALMSEFFDFVFLFSMNDEVVHTGFEPMAHYLIAVGCQKKN